MSRARHAAIGAAIGGAIGGFISRNAASTGGAIGAFVGAMVGETRVTARSRIDRVRERGQKRVERPKP
ncbi:hypothetical protein ZOD2009_14831 [Haladaptatus paucihalophilus DX253]|uniref:Uncharacterized protein n=1 Tax=Haladaptatus paucihalophilus DX253 TaxID=797209 RepID=E7QVX8_HALPU|nr:hypothetical protein ZOD2009_14831 [Haladaptatus paucihalophilus DX253]